MTPAAAAGSIWAAVKANGSATPERTALSWGGRHRKGAMSYATLIDEAERLAGVLSDHADAGDRLLLRTDNHAGAGLVWLAAVRARLVPCLLNGDTDDSSTRKVAAGIGARLTGRADGPPNVDPLSGVSLEADGRLIDLRGPGRAPIAEPTGEDLLEVTCTSGTTGTPKPLWFTHRAHLLSRQAWIRHLGLGPDDVILTHMPLAHASGSRNSFLTALVAGARCHLLEELHPASFWEIAQEERATFFMFHQPSAEALLETTPGPSDRTHHVRMACGAGGLDLIERFETRFGVRTLQNYGLSEAGTVTSPDPSLSPVTLAALRRFAADGTYVGAQFGDSTIVELRKADGSTVVTEGASGEFWISTPFACLTDLDGDRSATRWLSSGDLGVLGPGGSLHYVGRFADIVDRQGVRVKLVDVEDRARHVAGIADAGAVLVDGSLRLALVAERAEVGDLERLVVESLPTSHRPDEIAFVDEVPRNAMGRVRRALLR